MSAAFTPGPWAVNPLNAQVDAFDSGEPVPVCQLLWPTELRSEDETLANARLIAASSELYEALDKLIEACIEQGFAVGPHGRVAIGMDALRKARDDQ